MAFKVVISRLEHLPIDVFDEDFSHVPIEDKEAQIALGHRATTGREDTTSLDFGLKETEGPRRMELSFCECKNRYVNCFLFHLQPVSIVALVTSSVSPVSNLVGDFPVRMCKWNREEQMYLFLCRLFFTLKCQPASMLQNVHNYQAGPCV